MKSLKDLTQQLTNAEMKDKFYSINGTILRMLAPQHYQRPFIYTKKGWGEIERIESTTDGTPTEKRSPRRKGHVRKGEIEIKTGDCWTFKIEKNGFLGKECVMLPWGTQFGIFKKSLLRSLEAQRKLRYDAAPLALIKVYPLWLNVGSAPCESMQDKRIPEVILETRHTQGGDVMVEAFFDYIENREFNSFIEVDSEAPINEERLVGLLKTLNTLDNIGASKRGSMRIDKIEQVEMTSEDWEKLQKGEPIAPVIY